MTDTRNSLKLKQEIAASAHSLFQVVCMSMRGSYEAQSGLYTSTKAVRYTGMYA